MGVEIKEPSYIALHSCGGWVMAVVDDPSHKKEIAKEIARAVRQGYAISRVDCEDVRNGKVQMCKCGRKKRQVESKQQEIKIG